MLHTPVNDKKTKPETSRSEVEQEPQRLKSFSGGGDRLVNMQQAYGNQAALRMLRVENGRVIAANPMHRGVLQRKCACGNAASVAGTCTQCQQKQEMSLQRKAARMEAGSEISPTVHEVLNSPGQPLNHDTRTFMESRFGKDFSRIRVHTDAKASESAKAMNSSAYTVDQNIVFGTRQFAPNTKAGRGLLAHELTHTIQQAGVNTSGLQGKLEVTSPSDAAEQEAEKVSKAVQQGQFVHSPIAAKPTAIARQAPAAPAAPAATGLSAASISGGVTGLNMNVTATFSTCSDCTDGLEAIQVFWGTRRLDGVQVGTYTTVFPPLAATYDSFVDGGRNSPGGAVYSGNHPYYIGRPSLPPSYGYNPRQGGAGSVSGCTVNVTDTPAAARLHDQAFFETAFVCLNHRGSGKDKLLESFNWGFVDRGATYKPNPRTSRTSGLQINSSPSDKFTETLGADYSGYSYV
jgi:hypothetical protein